MNLIRQKAFLAKIWVRKVTAQLIMFIFCLMFFTCQSIYAYNPYSTRELDELEQEFAKLIHQSSHVLRHPLATAYINQLGKRLVNSIDFKLPYFFIVKSNEINAFAGPGGYIAVNSQLILTSEAESELAAVMAHEIAHVRLHHLYRMLEHQKQMRIPMVASVLASLALGVINPSLGGGALMASLTGLAQDNINFTRANEKEADRIGIDMLIQSGIDPRGMAKFFKKMQEKSKYYYNDIPAILRTHPLDDDRIAEAQNRCQHIKNKIYTENPDYPLFKELVRNHTHKDTKSLLDYYAKLCQQKDSLACRYGYALALMKVHDYQKSQTLLATLHREYTDNLYFALALADAELNLQHPEKAQAILKKLYTNYPENYALLVTYGEILIRNGKEKEAAGILLKASRLFKNDLTVCQQLSRAQALAHHKGYAYFTRAQCELIKGNKNNALSLLNIAKKLHEKDPYLKARINAKVEEIKAFY